VSCVYSLDDYSDAEIAQMVRAANRAGIAAHRERASMLDAFCAWLSAAGLGVVAATLKSSVWAWERVRTIWRRIFG
jgi:hypothetical protein